jgi:hypothetical protein
MASRHAASGYSPGPRDHVGLLLELVQTVPPDLAAARQVEARDDLAGHQLFLLAVLVVTRADQLRWG